MEASNGHASSPSSVANPWKRFMLDRSVIFLVLLSMTLQIVLVFGGTLRYRCGSRLLNLFVWGCYMGADFVATSALGAMINYSTGAMIYALWACVVMVHLGGPDTITAYSFPDSNLWKRRCFNILYQGSVAAYVVYVSAIQGGADIDWYLLAAAALIFIVGITKYAERALALWLASPSKIVSSAQPIHNYMKIEHALGLQIDEQIPDDEIADVDVFSIRHEYKVDSVDYQYIVAGEESFNEDEDNGEWSDGIVTIKDVWEHEGEVVTDNYLLCVSHALFKMYKRRFASLRFHESGLHKTERFFREWRFNKKQVFNILEMELKFLYDYMFSKSSGTAFREWGIGMRVVNICVVGLSWFLIVRGLQDTEDVLPVQRIVTYIVMCVAVGVEVFQLGRIVLSDWSVVWLICASIRQSRELRQRWWDTSTAKLIHHVVKVVGRVRKVVGGKYWQNQIPQLCIMETCFSAAGSYPFIMRVIGFLPFSELIKGGYIRIVMERHINRESLDNHFKDAVLDYVMSGRRAEALVQEWAALASAAAAKASAEAKAAKDHAEAAAACAEARTVEAHAAAEEARAAEAHASEAHAAEVRAAAAAANAAARAAAVAAEKARAAAVEEAARAAAVVEEAARAAAVVEEAARAAAVVEEAARAAAVVEEAARAAAAKEAALAAAAKEAALAEQAAAEEEAARATATKAARVAAAEQAARAAAEEAERAAAAEEAARAAAVVEEAARAAAVVEEAARAAAAKEAARAAAVVEEAARAAAAKEAALAAAAKEAARAAAAKEAALAAAAKEAALAARVAGLAKAKAAAEPARATAAAAALATAAEAARAAAAEKATHATVVEAELAAADEEAARVVAGLRRQWCCRRRCVRRAADVRVALAAKAAEKARAAAAAGKARAAAAEEEAARATATKAARVVAAEQAARAAAEEAERAAAAEEAARAAAEEAALAAAEAGRAAAAEAALVASERAAAAYAAAGRAAAAATAAQTFMGKTIGCGDARVELSRAKRMLEEGVGWEHQILAWHVATTICERLEDQSKIEDEDVKKNIDIAVRMSRYFAYVLVTCPELLPVDAENAKTLYREVFLEIMGLIGGNVSINDFCKNFKERSDISTEGRIVVRMATDLLNGGSTSVKDRWEEWASKWLTMLFTCGVYDKCGEHGERLTVGGELLTFVWVLTGHIRQVEESYNPTALKRDPRQWDLA